MRLPRDVSGRQLAALLENRGYVVTRQEQNQRGQASLICLKIKGVRPL